MNKKPENSHLDRLISTFVVLIVILTIVALCYVTFPVWGFLGADILAEMQERPVVQEAVRQQCHLPDYLADGYFDILDHDYFDWDKDNSEPEISCTGVEWQCTCAAD